MQQAIEFQPAYLLHDDDPRLVAMIPVVTTVADDKGRKMPYPDLLTALQKHTYGRVLIGDSDPAKEADTFAKVPTSNKNPARLAYGKDGLWVELTIPWQG